MFKGRSIQELATELGRRNEAKRDFIADSRSLNIKTEEEGGATVMTMEKHDDPDEQFGTTEHLHRSMGSRLKIPAPFYDRIRREHAPVFDDMVNGLLHRQPERRMVRTLDGNARFMASDRYRPIDYSQVAEAVLPILMEQDEMEVESSQVTDSKLYIKAFFPQRQAEMKVRQVGQIVKAGVMISNSEVGMGSFIVQQMVMVLKCTNGIVMPDASFRRTHIGRRIEGGEGAEEFFRDETRVADDKALMMKMQDVLRGSLQEDNFLKAVGRLEDAANDEITGDPVKAVEEVSKRFVLTENEQGSVLNQLVRGGDLTRWGMCNAVTRVSQDADSYDRATSLERIGGDIIELPKSDWEVVNKN